MKDLNVIVKKHLLNSIKEILVTFISKNKSEMEFYISFDRNAKDVIFPNIKKDQKFGVIYIGDYFSNFLILPEGFEVELDFFGKMEKVYIPFSSIVLISSPEKNFSIDFRKLIKKENEEKVNTSQDNIIFVDIN